MLERSKWISMSPLLGLALVFCCDDGDDDDDDDDPSTTMTGQPDDGDDDGTGSTSTAEPEPECVSDSDCGSGMMCSGGECIDMFWIVGDDGVVIGVAENGDAVEHPPLPAALSAIECVGPSDAWAVGEAGLVAQTIDGGTSWAQLPWPATADLRDIEADEHGTVATVGDAGTWLVLHRGAIRAVSGAEGDLEGIGFGPSGVLAVGRDGRLWRADLDAAQATQVDALDGAASAIDLAHDTTIGVVVGPEGAVWWSDDASSWTRRDAGTHVDLHAVQVARGGHAAIAVGDDGTVVHIEATRIEIVDIGDAALRDIHLDAAGNGAAVGRDGIVAATSDGGRTFAIWRLTTKHLLGVDAVGSVHW
jgi:photosystem II stability/assembly factor-like uncharacterized protein